MIRDILTDVLLITAMVLALPFIGAVLAIITLGEFHSAE